MNIIIAEDDPTSLLVLKATLEFMGHTVTTTTNGQELVDAFTSSFDIVITDVMMPIKNGLEAAKEIKQIRKVPIIALTAFDQSSKITDNNGNFISWLTCDFFLKKPVNTVDLENIFKVIQEKKLI